MTQLTSAIIAVIFFVGFMLIFEFHEKEYQIREFTYDSARYDTMTIEQFKTMIINARTNE